MIVLHCEVKNKNILRTRSKYNLIANCYADIKILHLQVYYADI